jgi:hypothetical protein
MAILSLSEINTSIFSGTFTNDELNSITDAIRFARSQIAQKNKFTLVKGTSVKFQSSKTGTTIFGTVEKVNRKFIIVKENGRAFGNWRVPASMLQAA